MEAFQAFQVQKRKDTLRLTNMLTWMAWSIRMTLLLYKQVFFFTSMVHVFRVMCSTSDQN